MNRSVPLIRWLGGAPARRSRLAAEVTTFSLVSWYPVISKDSSRNIRVLKSGQSVHVALSASTMMRPGAKIWQPTNSPGYHEVPSSIELTATASRTSILSQKPSWTQRHLKGWRVGILTGSILASVVCLINLAATIYGGVRSKVNHDGRKMIWEGDCEKVRKINTGLHLGLNVLSTLLLSASNYGMQCLSAPTRLEVDMAHAQRRWLDIGVLSFRNIRSISGKRATLWALLAASSMPLHLLYVSLPP